MKVYTWRKFGAINYDLEKCAEIHIFWVSTKTIAKWSQTSIDFLQTPPVVSAQCSLGTKANPNGSKKPDYDQHNYSQALSVLVSFFRIITNDAIRKPNIPQHDFRKFYNLQVFEILHREEQTSPQPIEIDFIFSITVVGEGHTLPTF